MVNLQYTVSEQPTILEDIGPYNSFKKKCPQFPTLIVYKQCFQVSGFLMSELPNQHAYKKGPTGIVYNVCMVRKSQL